MAAESSRRRELYEQEAVCEFDLCIQMSGLMLHVFNHEEPEKATKIAVSMPDARCAEPGSGPAQEDCDEDDSAERVFEAEAGVRDAQSGADDSPGESAESEEENGSQGDCGLEHLDGSPANAHVGYMRFDLRNLDTEVAGVPALGPAAVPAYEVIHRFKGERVDLGLEDLETRIRGRMRVPVLDGFAPILEPDPALLYPGTADGVLMRMDLCGGTVSVPHVDTHPWKFIGDLHPDGREYSDKFGGEVHWVRRVQGSRLLLRIVRFDDSGAVEIPLRPIRAKGGRWRITIRIANLCKVNPLEWAELPLRSVESEDEDFKWLYRLLQMKSGEKSLKDLFCEKRMPIPQADVTETTRADFAKAMRVGMIQNCTPLQASYAF